MPRLVTDGRTVSYEEAGAGSVVLLLHGSPGNAKAWARVGERLADRYRVIAPDLPGYGETTPQSTPGGPTVGYAAELIEALIREVGAPAVVAGHSYGGVVALAVALRGRVSIGALALFEPVALPVLAMAGETETFTAAKATIDNYVASFEGGNERAVQTMVDFWFGAGAFERMPVSVTAYLLRSTAANVEDVRATFREAYSADAFRALPMPIVTVVGDRSPDITHRIARAIAAHAPRASVMTLAKANHALTTTHVEAVAQAIAEIAAGR
jgi:pimeloyl-ACP methyl ester carboxylesterase